MWIEYELYEGGEVDDEEEVEQEAHEEDEASEALSSATSVRQEAVTSPRKRARFLLRCVTAALPTTMPILLARDLNLISY